MSELLIEHPYYCSDSNYYSNEPTQRHETIDKFLEEWKGYIDDESMIDMNLIFRFDVHDWEEDGNLTASFFMIQQRKGVFVPIHITKYEKKDDERMIPILKMHWKKLQEIWNPISLGKENE